jgi:hypothetical protein
VFFNGSTTNFPHFGQKAKKIPHFVFASVENFPVWNQRVAAVLLQIPHFPHLFSLFIFLKKKKENKE